MEMKADLAVQPGRNTARCQTCFGDRSREVLVNLLCEQLAIGRSHPGVSPASEEQLWAQRAVGQAGCCLLHWRAPCCCQLLHSPGIRNPNLSFVSPRETCIFSPRKASSFFFFIFLKGKKEKAFLYQLQHLSAPDDPPEA